MNYLNLTLWPDFGIFPKNIWGYIMLMLIKHNESALMGALVIDKT